MWKKLDLFNLKVLSVQLIKDILRRHLDYGKAMISHYDIYFISYPKNLSNWFTYSKLLFYQRVEIPEPPEGLTSFT